MDPQEYLKNRLTDIKNLLSGDASLDDTLTLSASGGLPGKIGIRTGMDMLRTAGKPGQAKMGLLGGDAPVNENVNLAVNRILDSSPNELLSPVLSEPLRRDRDAFLENMAINVPSHPLYTKRSIDKPKMYGPTYTKSSKDGIAVSAPMYTKR